MKIPIVMFMSEIKFNFTLKKKKKKKKKKKIKFSVSFMLLFAIIMFYLYANSHVRKLTFFLAISRQFRLVQRVLWV